MDQQAVARPAQFRFLGGQVQPPPRINPVLPFMTLDPGPARPWGFQRAAAARGLRPPPARCKAASDPASTIPSGRGLSGGSPRNSRPESSGLTTAPLKPAPRQRLQRQRVGDVAERAGPQFQPRPLGEKNGLPGRVKHEVPGPPAQQLGHLLAEEFFAVRPDHRRQPPPQAFGRARRGGLEGAG